MDFDTPNDKDEVILAAANGIAYTFADRGPNSFGNHVNIDHGNSYFTLYAHLKTILVNNGELVKQGQVVGIEGNTGFSRGDHIHFGLHTGDPQSDAINSTSILIDHLVAKETLASDFGILNGNQFFCALPGGKFYNSNNVQLNSLAKIENQGAVYWLQNEKAYHVLSPEIINAMSSLPGWGNDKIYSYPTDVLEVRPPGTLPLEGTFQKGPDFIELDSSSNGLLIRQTGTSRAYVMEGGEKRWIKSIEVFNKMGYDPNDIIDVSKDIDSPIFCGPYLADGYPPADLNDGYLPADLNKDGYVNTPDFGILMSYWGDVSKPPADLDKDGHVGTPDFGIMMSNWYGAYCW